MVRGLNIDCGCFSIAKNKVGWDLIGRDLIVLGMAILVFVHPKRKPRNLIDYIDTPTLCQDSTIAYLSADRDTSNWCFGLLRPTLNRRL